MEESDSLEDWPDSFKDEFNSFDGDRVSSDGESECLVSE
jgi:hypothetical protein